MPKIGSPFGVSTRGRSNYRIARQPGGTLVCTPSGTAQIVEALIRPAFAGYCFPPIETIGRNGEPEWRYTPQPHAELPDTLEIEWTGSVLSCQSLFVSACMYTAKGHVTRHLVVTEDKRTDPPTKHRTYPPIINSVATSIQPHLVIGEEIALDQSDTLEAALEGLLDCFRTDPAVSVSIALSLSRPLSADIPGLPPVVVPIALIPALTIEAGKSSQATAEAISGAVTNWCRSQDPDLEQASLLIQLTAHSSVSGEAVPILSLRNIIIAFPASAAQEWLGS